MDHWHIRRPALLDSLEPNLVNELRTAAQVRAFAPGELVFRPIREPESVWLVEHGLIRIHRLREGRDLTIALARPGDLFGELGVLTGSERKNFAEAIRRSSCWRVPRGAFLRIVRRDPEAGFAITKQVAGRLARIEARLEDLAFRSVDARIARTLLYLAEEFGRSAGDWTEVDVALTQAELATLVGTTRQSVSECMRSLAKSGCLMRDRGRLALDLAKLRKHVDRSTAG